MSRIYLVRHGQAPFGTGDYDRLTATGVTQCEQLARHWRVIGRKIDCLYSGTLRRQRDSAAAFARGFGDQGGAGLEPRALAGLEEYDHRALLDAHDPGGSRVESQDPRDFHRRLTRALMAWTDESIAGVERYVAFRQRCAAALAALLAATGRGRTAVLFASAGSLAAAMQGALGIGDRDAVRLKLTFYNTGVSCLLWDGETITIESLNTVSHLEHPAFLRMITHR
ncbi:MAG: histidine phosphatase family protein [Steroidobacteraceae bacterium]